MGYQIYEDHSESTVNKAIQTGWGGQVVERTILQLIELMLISNFLKEILIYFILLIEWLRFYYQKWIRENEKRKETFAINS